MLFGMARGTPTERGGDMIEDWNMAAYEFSLPNDFNYKKFKHDVMGGLDGYWAIAFPEKGITRFKGVLLPSYVRVFVDYVHGGHAIYITTPQNQEMTALEVANWFFKKFPSCTVYKDDRQVLP